MWRSLTCGLGICRPSMNSYTKCSHKPKEGVMLFCCTLRTQCSSIGNCPPEPSLLKDQSKAHTSRQLYRRWWMKHVNIQSSDSVRESWIIPTVLFMGSTGWCSVSHFPTGTVSQWTAAPELKGCPKTTQLQIQMELFATLAEAQLFALLHRDHTSHHHIFL